MLTVDDTTRAYAGKTGCMCGCNGSYRDSARARKTAITQLLNHPEMKLDTWNLDSEGTAGCIYVESKTRNRVLYLTQSGVEKMQKFLTGQAAPAMEPVDEPVYFC